MISFEYFYCPRRQTYVQEGKLDKKPMVQMDLPLTSIPSTCARCLCSFQHSSDFDLHTCSPSRTPPPTQPFSSVDEHYAWALNALTLDATC